MSKSIRLSDYFAESFLLDAYTHDYPAPWTIMNASEEILGRMLRLLDVNYRIYGQVAIHKDAEVEERVTFKGGVILSKGCHVASNSCLRNGVYVGENVHIGHGSEVKASFVFSNSALAHFNYVGNSMIGSMVNLEAGAVLANHYNERDDKEIAVNIHGEIVKTGVIKFGAIVGDGTKIGANAVTSPGTILMKKSIVGRLELVNQLVKLNLP